MASSKPGNFPSRWLPFLPSLGSSHQDAQQLGSMDKLPAPWPPGILPRSCPGRSAGPASSCPSWRAQRKMTTPGRLNSPNMLSFKLNNLASESKPYDYIHIHVTSFSICTCLGIYVISYCGISTYAKPMLLGGGSLHLLLGSLIALHRLVLPRGSVKNTECLRGSPQTNPYSLA